MQTWMPGTIQKPVPLTGNSRRSNGPMPVCYGVVLHVNAAYSDDLYSWIMQGGQMSCHFQVNLKGQIYQYIPIDWTSWCQSAGNDNWISIETSGQANEMLNPAQLDAVKRIWAFCQAQRGLANQLAEYPTERGFGWHGMGAAPYWNGPQWGHAVCPGVRRPQRQDAINFVKGDTGMASAEYNALLAKYNAVQAQVNSLIAGETGDDALAASTRALAAEANRKNQVILGQRPPAPGEKNLVPPTEPFLFALVPGVKYAPTTRLWSGDGRLQFVVQGDGNLVERNVAGDAVWASGTNRALTTTPYLTLQSDGSLALYSGVAGAKALWGKNAKGAAKVVLQTDGNLVFQDSAGKNLAGITGTHKA